jgi:NAD(P)-dependent dehydrogenase (short-subunit alcohol dehydrogenase family)
MSTQDTLGRQENRTPALSLAGQRLVITGGTSGLGLALVEEALAQAAHVAIVARHREGIDAVRRRWPAVHGIAGDVARKEDIHPLAIQLASALGGVDVLVNNASSLGPVPLAPLGDTDCEDFERAIAANLLGPFRLTKALLGSLAASAREGRGGLVVNISSDAAVSAYPGWGAYGASKAALLHMTRIWQEELRPVGVRMLSFDPGDMDTPLHAAAIPGADPTTLKKPATSARELAELIADELTTTLRSGAEGLPERADE